MARFSFKTFRTDSGKKFDIQISYKIGGRWYIYTTVFCEEELTCAIRNAYQVEGVTEVKTKIFFD